MDVLAAVEEVVEARGKEVESEGEDDEGGEDGESEEGDPGG